MKTRHTARAVLLDPQDRALLFQFELPKGMIAEGPARFWATPGGAIEADEDVREALAREVGEETGIAEFEVGPELWLGEQTLTVHGVPTFMRERFFLVRAKSEVISRDGWTEFERKVMRAHRWWTVDELATTSETVFPKNFGGLVASYLRDGARDVQRIEL
jgi:8-oxo-dGTP pyrophosphatase MutT (NUDIX family)